ncbi:MAG: DEAD/DEAH box helicase [Acidimicrobiia bacterium]|nr:DEAD/DEAH box helicase [Acidimicrobiia bacterium]
MSVSFAQLGLPKPLVNKLAAAGITEAFPVQEACIPDALAGKDVSGKAPTGSGKTLAFGLPLLSMVERATRNHPRGLILAPTRELAEQIKQELVPLARTMDRFVFAIYGGVGYGPQINALRKGVDILVATPGRLEDLIEQGTVNLSNADFVVVDEADRMADMGFMPAVRRILNATAKKRQTLLFSATLDGDIAVLSRTYQNNPVRHEAGTVEPETIDATHHFWMVEHEERIQHAADVISKSGRSIVFTRTRHGADRLAGQLARLEIGAVAMHGGRSQNQRQAALRAFSSGNAQALIATDVAARGIHIDAVASVIHYDPPADAKDYLHRSGRTARAGATGTIVSLVTREQRRATKRLMQDLDLRVPLEPPRLDAVPQGEPFQPIARPTSNRAERRTERRVDRDRPSDRPIDRPADRPNREPRRASERSPSVYIANLPWDADDDVLHELFSRYGHVQQATVIFDKRTGRSKGFGFVDMPEEAASTAIDQLHGSMMDGRDLTVRFAQPRTWGV